MATQERETLWTLATTIFWPWRTRHDVANGLTNYPKQGILIGYQLDGNVFCVVDFVRSHEDALETCQRMHQCEILGELLVDQPKAMAGAIAAPDTGMFCVAYDSARPHQRDQREQMEIPRVQFHGAVTQRNCHVNFVLYDPHELDACRFVQSSSAIASPLERAVVQMKTHLEERRLCQQITNHQQQKQPQQPQRQQQRQQPCQTSQKLLWSLVEFLGYYLVYLPLRLICMIVSKVAGLFSLRVPNGVPLLRGKCIKEFSTTFALLENKLMTMASLPRRLHDLYCQQPARYAPELVEVFNTTCYMVIDFVLGWFFYQYFLQPYMAPTRISLMVETACEMLHDRVVWLMGAPAGFKLNLPLATVLGNGILLWMELWEFLLQQTLLQPQLLVFLEQLGATKFGFVVFGGVSLSVQLTLLTDLVMWCSGQSFAVYKYFAKVNTLQLNLLSSLWKLLLGKKNNVLRQRVDSCEYDVSQLLLGTLLFTILSFLITTTTVFYVSFSLVRFGLFLFQIGCWLPVVVLRVMPFYSLLLWLVTAPHTFTSHVQFRQVPKQRTSCSFAVDAIDKSKSPDEMEHIRFCFIRMHVINAKHDQLSSQGHHQHPTTNKSDPTTRHLSSSAPATCNPMIVLQLTLVKCSVYQLFGKWQQQDVTRGAYFVPSAVRALSEAISQPRSQTSQPTTTTTL